MVVPEGALFSVKLAADNVVGLLVKLVNVVFVSVILTAAPERLASVNAVGAVNVAVGVFVFVYHTGDVIVLFPFRVISI